MGCTAADMQLIDQDWASRSGDRERIAGSHFPVPALFSLRRRDVRKVHAAIIVMAFIYCVELFDQVSGFKARLYLSC